MPFNAVGSQAMRQSTIKRKTPALASYSNTNRTIEDLNFNRVSFTNEDETDFYTMYDLDAQKAVSVSETKSDAKFIFEASLVDITNCTMQDTERPIISLHWAEISDHVSLMDQKNEDEKEPNIMNKVRVDDNMDYKPYFWFI